MALEFLKKKKVDAIYATSDNMAFGVLQALDELGLELPVSGFDGTDEARALVKEGKMLSTVDDKPKVLGALAIETANRMLRGKPVTKKIEYDVELIDA
jgi:ribose transport system substrate-binding protein